MSVGTDIVLVNPPLDPSERYGALALGGVYMPPLGLGYLAAVLRREGFRCEVLDCPAMAYDTKEACRQILARNPRFAGLSAATMAVHSAAAVARHVKAARPTVKTLIGGPHVTAVPVETMREFPHFDAAFIGEAEAILPEALRAFDDGQEAPEVPGVWTRGLASPPWRILA